MLCLNDIFSSMVCNVKHRKRYKYPSEDDSWIQLQSIHIRGHYITTKKNKEIFYVYCHCEESTVNNSVVNRCYGFWVFAACQTLGRYSNCYQQLPLVGKKPFYTWGNIMVRHTRVLHVANLLSLFYLQLLLSSLLPFVGFLYLIMSDGIHLKHAVEKKQKYSSNTSKQTHKKQENRYLQS